MEKLRKFEEIGFNIKATVERLGNEEIFMVLIPSFIIDIKSYMGQLMIALDENKFGECGRILHNIRGVAATLGHEGIKIRSEILEDEMSVIEDLKETKGEIVEWLIRETEQYIDYCSGIVDKL